MSNPQITHIRPDCAIEGGRVTLHGERFPIGSSVPVVRVAGHAARVVLASPTQLSIVIPSGIVDGGRVPVHIEGSAAEEAAFINVAAPFATGLHQVDNPVFDREGNLYVTYSGTRGQQVPVSVFRVRPNGTREPFSTGIVNPTSTAFGPDGSLYVSSRFEGTVYRVADDGSVEQFATHLGVACGLAFSPDGRLFVGDRSGTIFTVEDRKS